MTQTPTSRQPRRRRRPPVDGSAYRRDRDRDEWETDLLNRATALYQTNRAEETDE